MAALRGQQSVAGFFTRSQLNTVFHTRRYTSEAPSAAAATPTSDTRSRHIHRLRWYTPSENIHALSANDNANLNLIQKQTGVKVKFSGVPKPGAREYRVLLIGEEDALEECKNLILSLTPETGTKATTSQRLAEGARPLNRFYTFNTSNTPNTSNTSNTSDTFNISNKSNTSNTRQDAAPGLESIRTQFKNIMRHTSSNITLLTTDILSGPSHPTPSRTPKHWNLRGITISSLTPVTLSPEPIVSFNIKAPSRTLDAILASKLLTATFLTPTVEGAKIAHAFTVPNEDPSTPFRTLEDAGLLAVHGNQRSGPKFVGEGVAARLRCVVWKSVKVADHVVLFARVSHAWTKDLVPVKDTFLGYSKGGYRGMSGEDLDGVMAREEVEHVFGALDGTMMEDGVESGSGNVSRDASGEELDLTETYYRAAEHGSGEDVDLTEAYYRAAEESGVEDSHIDESPKTSQK